MKGMEFEKDLKFAGQLFLVFAFLVLSFAFFHGTDCFGYDPTNLQNAQEEFLCN